MFMNLITLCSEAGSLNNNRSCLAAAVGVIELVTPIAIILVTLCCAAQVRLRCSTNRPVHFENPRECFLTHQ
jgi:hypothetical protein